MREEKPVIAIFGPVVRQKCLDLQRLGLHGEPDVFMEIFSPPRVAPVVHAHGLKAVRSMDLSTGWDFLVKEHKCSGMKDVAWRMPSVTMLSPPCKMFSQIMDTNWFRMDPTKRWQELERALELLDFAVWVMQYQLEHKRHFIFEHPVNAKSWSRPNVVKLAGKSNVFKVEFDQCMVGLKSPVSRIAMKKRTTLLTTLPTVVAAFESKQCDGSHDHVPINDSEYGKKLSSASQEYPEEMCVLLANAVRDFVAGR
jgi:hypothetical protein